MRNWIIFPSFSGREKKEEFYIDDITWNDLDMDRIYALINQNVSPAGDECLYEILRKPVFREEELKERQRLLEFFADRKGERHRIQALLARIRKPGNVSIYEAVSVTKEVEIQGKGLQIGMCAAFFLSLLFFAVMPSPGIFCFLGVCILNIITYFMQKQDIDLYLSSCRCVIQLLEAQKELEKIKIPELESYKEEGKKYRERLRTFQKGSFLVLEQSSTGGGLEGLVMDYIRMLTHIDLIKFSAMMKAMQKYQEEILGLMKIFGYLDAMISIASFRESLPYYSLPELDKGGQGLSASGKSVPSFAFSPCGQQYRCRDRHSGNRLQCFGKVYISEEYSGEYHPGTDCLYRYSLCLPGSLF